MTRKVPRVWLYRVNDRSYGFQVVALEANTEKDARERLMQIAHCAHFGESWRRGYAELEDSFDLNGKGYATMEFEE